jgi:ornithine cyclodeaminase/alanine dehydrogenase-like protein (mu-crystallin family)
MTSEDELTASVLRLSPEPVARLDDPAVHEALTRNSPDYLAHLQRRLVALAREPAAAILPPKLVFTDPGGGDFRVMPGIVRGPHGVLKTVKVVGTNRGGRLVPDQVTVGRVLVVHPSENFVTHLVDACVLSSARTGGCAAMAIRLLAPQRKRVTVLGAGRVGFYCALYAAALGEVEEVRFADQRPARAEAAAALLGRHRPDLTVDAGTTEGGLDSDVLILATTSLCPVVGPADTSAALVISVGADTEDQRELADDWLDWATLYVESPDCDRYGDLLAWRRSGQLAPTPLPDLLDLVSGRTAPGGRTRTAFVSTGSALFDNLTVEYLLHGGAEGR